MHKPNLVNVLGCILRWIIVLATVAFLAITVVIHWQDVQQLRFCPDAFQLLAIALTLNLFAHLGLGIVWGWILETLHYNVSWYWALITFAMVEVAKYLPGDIWQVYGRIRIAKVSGIPVSAGAISIILESTYLSIAAVALGIFLTSQPTFQIFSALILLIMLISIRPRILNWIATQVHRVRFRFSARHDQAGSTVPSSKSQQPIFTLQTYPTKVLFGLTGLILLRSVSFLYSIAALSPIESSSYLPIVAAFSVAWVIGIVMPGISGGVGLFEALVLALLQGAAPVRLLLGGLVLYRLLNTITEAIAAGLGWLLKGQRSFAELARLPHP